MNEFFFSTFLVIEGSSGGTSPAMKNSIAGVVALTALLGAFVSPQLVRAEPTYEPSKETQKSFEKSWDDAAQTFERMLHLTASQLMLKGKAISLDDALKYSSGVEVCRDGAEKCEPVAQAGPNCGGGSCGCTWTGCNDFAAFCASKNEGDFVIECVTTYTPDGYPVGLGCSCKVDS